MFSSISQRTTLKFQLQKSRSFAECEIIGSSLLLIFERKTNEISVKWIDFAHVYKPSSGKKNDGVLYGLGNLVKALEDAGKARGAL